MPKFDQSKTTSILWISLSHKYNQNDFIRLKARKNVCAVYELNAICAVDMVATAPKAKQINKINDISLEVHNVGIRVPRNY